MNKQESVRKRICQFFEKNKKLGNKATLQHFLAEGIARSTIYDAIKRVNDGIGPERRKGSGRPVKKMPPKQIKLLQRHFDHKDGKSQREAARKFQITQPYVCKLLKDLSIDCRAKITIPDRTEQQAKDAKTKCRIISEKYKNRVWILDDESYFPLSHRTIAGNNKFYSSDVSQTPAEVKLSRKAKFEKKLLVWVAFSKNGLSEVFICPSGLAIDQHIYKDECLKRRLIPFIKKYHSDGNSIFWPDLASAHYAESVCDFMMESKIEFVEKYENPANLPECRPIEPFWNLVKQKVYANAWKAKDLNELEKRIRDCIKKIDKSELASQFNGFLPKLRYVGRHGVIEMR